MRRSKSSVMTFKADESLKTAMKGIPNKSEFIRAAVLAALDSACPLCNGTGILSPHQREHWKQFAHTHSLEECDKCHEPHIVCLNRRERPGRRAAKENP